MVNTTPKKFSCLECGTPYEAYPPSDTHKIASLKPSSEGNSVEVKYLCTRCSNKNSLHWQGSTFRVVGGI